MSRAVSLYVRPVFLSRAAVPLMLAMMATLCTPWRACAEDPSLSLSFSTPVNVSQTPTFSQAPAICQDTAGNVAVAWEEWGGWLLPLAYSETDGQTFAPFTLVVPGGWNLSFGQIRMASLGEGDIQMIFTSFNTLTGGAEIVHAASRDGGASFPEAKVISTIDYFNSYAGDVAAGWGVAAAWSNTDLSTGSRIDFCASEDGGATFTVPKRVDAASGFVTSPSIALHGNGDVYIAWVENVDPFGGLEGDEIFFTRSTDRGVTFSPPVNLTNNSEKAWPPRIAVDESGTIYLVWTEGDFTIDMKLLFAVSHDGGASFSAPRVLVGPSPSVEGRIAAVADGVLWLAWHTWESPYDPATYSAHIVRSLDAGETFSQPVALPGLMEISSIAPERVFVTWHDTPDSEEWPEVFVSRGDAVVCGDANADGAITATDALMILQVGVGAAECAECRCDVNSAGGISATDALIVLRVAVGEGIALACPAC
jgi:hypothetical protein